MTQRDKWAKRPAVMRYFAFRDEVRAAGMELCNGSTIVFHIPMPKSWSKKKRDAMRGEYHQQKRDLDNYTKGVLDALFEDDSHIADIRVIKRWADEGAIEVINVTKCPPMPADGLPHQKPTALCHEKT